MLLNTFLAANSFEGLVARYKSVIHQVQSYNEATEIKLLIL